MPRISVVIPAYNEELALPATLAALSRAQAAYAVWSSGDSDVVVVNNASTDATGMVARCAGARVIAEPRQGIAHARNAGARGTHAPWLFFLDADTIVPEDILTAIHSALDEPGCVGGAPATLYRYRKRALRPYMEMWKLVARMGHMTQGVGQFATAEAFRAVGGYDSALRMAEDTDFNRKLRTYARWQGGHTTYLADTVIEPSSRRLDEWSVWRTVLITNPIATRMFLRSRWLWRGWREGTVR